MKHIAILTGGTSSEREVSLWSSEYFVESLTQRAAVTVFDFPQDRDLFLASKEPFDAVIPVLHGRGGEDGVIQGFLQTLRMPFLFSDVEAHVIGMDKRLAKLVARDVGVSTPESVVVSRGKAPSIPLPVVVKPVDGGSTIGVSVVRALDEIGPALEKAFALSHEVLVEAFVAGREFTVAVIEERGKAIALPVIEIVSNDGFFDFESKYVNGKMASEVCPAQISDDLRDQLQQNAIRMHQGIGARHATRSDFIVDLEGTPWFLEINTIPGMTKNSLFPKAVRASGRDFGELLMSWIEEVTPPPAHAGPNPAGLRL